MGRRGGNPATDWAKNERSSVVCWSHVQSAVHSNGIHGRWLHQRLLIWMEIHTSCKTNFSPCPSTVCESPSAPVSVHRNKRNLLQDTGTTSLRAFKLYLGRFILVWLDVMHSSLVGKYISEITADSLFSAKQYTARCYMTGPNMWSKANQYKRCEDQRAAFVDRNKHM